MGAEIALTIVIFGGHCTPPCKCMKIALASVNAREYLVHALTHKIRHFFDFILFLVTCNFTLR